MQYGVNFPTVSRTNVILEMTPEYFEQYSEIERAQAHRDGGGRDGDIGDVLSVLSSKITEPGKFYTGLRQAMANMPETKVSPLKRNFVIDYILRGLRLRERNARNARSAASSSVAAAAGASTTTTAGCQENSFNSIFPMLINAHHVEQGVQPLVADFKSHGITKFEVITGVTPLEERQRIQRRYNAGKLDIVILSSAGSTGLDFRDTKTVISYECRWNDSSENQAIARGIRMGCKNNVAVIRLFISKGKHIEALAKVMTDKKSCDDVRIVTSDELLRLSSDLATTTSEEPAAAAAAAAPPTTAGTAAEAGETEAIPTLDDATVTALDTGNFETIFYDVSIDGYLFLLQTGKSDQIATANKHLKRWSVDIPSADTTSAGTTSADAGGAASAAGPAGPASGAGETLQAPEPASHKKQRRF